MAESMMLRAKEKALAPRAHFPIEWCLGPRAWQQYPLLRFDSRRPGNSLKGIADGAASIMTILPHADKDSIVCPGPMKRQSKAPTVGGAHE